MDLLFFYKYLTKAKDNKYIPINILYFIIIKFENVALIIL